MLTITGYFDASGTHDGSATVALAGWLSTAKGWGPKRDLNGVEQALSLPQGGFHPVAPNRLYRSVENKGHDLAAALITRRKYLCQADFSSLRSISQDLIDSFVYFLLTAGWFGDNTGDRMAVSGD